MGCIKILLATLNLDSDTTSKVRTLLFAGIRAAVLWRQKGGSRLKLLLSRKKYVEQAELVLQKFK